MQTIRLLALACAPGLVQADTLSYSSTLALSSLPIERRVVFNPDIVVPLFDPNLGTLQSVTFDISRSGLLTYQIIQRSAYFGFEDFDSSITSTFLGVTEAHQETRPGGSLRGGDTCGVPVILGNVVPCPNEEVAIGLHLGLHGVIRDGYSSIGSAIGDTSVFSHFTGALPMSLAPFIGIGNFSAPMNMVVDGIPDNGSFIAGDLIGPQSMWLQVNWTYDYSPATTTVAPEPPTLAMLGIGLLACAVATQRSRLHRVQEKLI